MNFTSFHFVAFFFVTIIIGHLLKNRPQRIFLLIASYYFYGVFEPYYLVLILLSTVWDWMTALGIEAARTAREHPNPSQGRPTLAILSERGWLSLSVTMNLALLFYFKYTNFGIEILNDLSPVGGTVFSWPVANILLPVGISFYTFQSMSYTIDVYRRQIAARKSLIDFALYVAFFPQLVAGPIVRATTFMKELDQRLPVMKGDILLGVSRIVSGLFMKLVLSDNLAPMVNEVFANPGRFHPTDIWIASLAFGFQIYLDFAGYTDIARGVARLFGFEFEVNFLYPMAAANIADHWNRWHISLTTWLRDYLYIPLGGSRIGRVRTYFNILAVWLFAGIWHGPAYHFIAWGLWQWVMISAHRVFSGSAAHRWINRRGGIPYDLFSRVLTIFCLIFGFIWFRAETLTIATRMQGMLFGISDLPAMIAGRSPSAAPISVPVHTPYIALLALLFLYDYVMKRFQIEYFTEDRNRNKLVGLLTGMIAAILILSSPETSDFLYFQF